MTRKVVKTTHITFDADGRAVDFTEGPLSEAQLVERLSEATPRIRTARTVNGAVDRVLSDLCLLPGGQVVIAHGGTAPFYPEVS